MSEKAVWIVLVSDGDKTCVYRVFSHWPHADHCVEWVKANKRRVNINGIWVKDVWMEAYTVHERNAP